MTISLDELIAVYLEWTGLRPELIGVTKNDFARWAASTKPELAAAYKERPVEFSLQCREVAHLCSKPAPSVGIGPQTLKRYMAKLVTVYRAMPEKDKPTFIEFLKNLQATYHTEAELRIHLHQKTNTQKKEG